MYPLVGLILVVLGILIYLIKKINNVNLENNSNEVLAQSRFDKTKLLICVVIMFLVIIYTFIRGI